jgi:hypothetical protein
MNPTQLLKTDGLSYKQLAEIFEYLDGQRGLHTKTPALSHTGMLTHQPGGLFDVPGLENEVISTHVTPMGLGGKIPAFSNRKADPRYNFILGWQASNGSMPNAPCDDAPKTFMKGGSLTGQFGRIPAQSNTIEIDKVLLESRYMNTDLQLMGAMLGMDTLAAGEFPDNPLDTVVEAEMVGMGVQLERLLAPLLWSGDISNNTALGGYKEFPGLDNQIRTGQVDADSNASMPAADSVVLDFDYNMVDGVGEDLVSWVTSVHSYLKHLATRTRVNPVTWAIVMRPELWEIVSSVWPCRYASNGCSVVVGGESTNPIVINDRNNVDQRDRYRNDMYLDVNGERVTVITDDGIFEQNDTNDGSNLEPGEIASTIFFVPLKIRSTFPVLYWEYVPYTDIGRQLAAMGQGARLAPWWTDGGKFLWTADYIKWCLDLTVKIEPRVILRTPHLAAKITNVKYAPRLHYRSWDPASGYFADGGVSLRTVPASFAVWK